MIQSEVIREVLGINCPSHFSFDFLALSNTTHSNVLSFMDDERYLEQLNNNRGITGVFVEERNSAKISGQKTVIVVEDPRWCYYTLQNYFAKKNKKDFDSIVDSSTRIFPGAYVAPKNVKIGRNCIIYPNATILEDSELGDNCVIQSGAIIGSEGFEYKRVRDGVLSVYHDGKAVLGNFVDIGANTCVDKGFSFRDTEIGNFTKIDNLVHIGHCAHIGERCFIAACAQIGAVNMENDVWVGPSVNLLSGQNIGERAYITVGSLVTKDVQKGQKVTGYFAMPHEQFIREIKKREAN